MFFFNFCNFLIVILLFLFSLEEILAESQMRAEKRSLYLKMMSFVREFCFVCEKCVNGGCRSGGRESACAGVQRNRHECRK